MNEAETAIVTKFLAETVTNSTALYKKVCDCVCGECKDHSPVADRVTNQISGILAECVFDDENRDGLSGLAVASSVSVYVFDVLSSLFFTRIGTGRTRRSVEIRRSAKFFRTVADGLDTEAAAADASEDAKASAHDTPLDFLDMPPEIRERIKKIVAEMRVSMGLKKKPNA